MRIAVVSSNREVIGGAETYLRWLLRALIARGHELCVAFEHEAEHEERALDRGLGDAPRFSLPELGLARWQERLVAFAPDVVYAHRVSQPALEGWLVRRFKAVTYAHDFHGSCATGTRRHTVPALSSCERTFGPACLAINYLRGCGMRRPDHLLSTFGRQRARAELMREYSAVIVASRHVRDVYLRQGLGADHVRILPYPTLEWSAAPEPPASRELRGQVLFVGRITELKGLDHAVRAVALAERWLGRELGLLVAGEGPELAPCLALARELSVNVRALGWVEDEAKRKLFGEVDALLVPSLWPEPFGIVGIEAGALGVPAIGYALGGIPDWLVGGVSGELAEGLDPAALALALVRALRDPAHHAALGRGAWEVARRHLPEDHIMELERILANEHRNRIR